MKTSNKILIGLLVLILAIPFIATNIFKYKIAHGQSTPDEKVLPRVIPNYIQKGNLSNYKAIKIIQLDTANTPTNTFAGKKELMTYIKYGAQPAYELWASEKTDSVQISQSGDTLVFTYNNRLLKGGGYSPSHLILYITIGKWVPVILDHSKLTLQSPMDNHLVQNSQSLADIYLKNHSFLQIGADSYLMTLDSARSKTEGKMVFSRNSSDLPLQDSIVMPTFMRIHAHHSEVNIHNYAIFSELILNIADSSTLTINNDFSVKNLTGQINKEATIKSSADAIKKLAPIIQ